MKFKTKALPNITIKQGVMIIIIKKKLYLNVKKYVEYNLIYEIFL